jgi:tetratricopeptide (TPR) repeat protein
MDIEPISPAGRRPTAAPGRRVRAWTMAAPLAVLAVVPFLPVLDNGFVNLDDYSNFLDNPHFRGLGSAQIAWAWTTYWLGVYQPLAWMLFEAQYAACGLDPQGYHLTSLLLHAVTAVALYILTLALIRRARPDLLAANAPGVVLGSALAVALFAVHPLRVEVVAWASCQPYLPCTALAVLAASVYVVSADSSWGRRAAGLAGTWVLFALAMLFKAPAIALPAVLLVLDYYPLRRLGGGTGRWFGPNARRIWAEKLPFFALSLVFAVIAVQAKRSTDSLLALEQRGLPARIGQACYALWFYLWKTVWPAGLCAYYPMPERFDWRASICLACGTLVAAASVTVFLLRRRHPGLLTAWLAYLVLLAPSSGLVSIGSVIAADRYSYLTTISGVPLLAAAIARLTGPGRGRALITVGVAAAGLGLIAGLAGSSWSLSRTWRDTVVLASHALIHGGRHPDIYLGLGWGLEQRGDLAGAEATYRATLRLEPRHVTAMIRLGMVRLRQGRLAGATALLHEAVRLQPDLPEAHNSLGKALAAQDRLDEAMIQFTEALRLRPGFAEARSNLAVARALSQQGGR